MKCSLLTLSCYVDSELPAARKGELEAHLVGCHRCRSGLGHLREEVERVEGLARVHLPEGSVRLLLEHTRLIAPGDPMPAIPDAGIATGPSPTTPPWLRGGAGAALPWASARPVAPPRRPGGPPAAGGPVEPAPAAPSTPDTFDVFAARMAPPGPPAPAVPEPRTERPLPEPPVETALPDPPVEPALEVDLDEQVIAAAAAEPWTQTEPEPASEGAAPPREGRLARRRTRIEARRAEAEAAAAAEAEAAAIAEAEAAAVAEAEAEAAAAAAAEAAAAAAAAAEVVEPPAVSSIEVPQEEPAGFAPVLTSSASGPGRPGSEIAAAAVPPGGDAVPAVWTPESSAEAPPAPKYPLTDDDALDAPSMVERFGPMPAPKPSMLDRVREKLALRRALRVAALDDVDDGIEIVSGPGAPARAPRSRADLARRRSEALRPSARPDGTAWSGEDDVDPMAPPEVPIRREPTVDELLPPPARPSSLPGATPRPPLAPPPALDDVEFEDPVGWHPVEPEVAAAPSRRRRRAAAMEEEGVPAVAAASGQASAVARTVDGRRLTVVLGAAILLMFIVGVASARSTTPLPPSTGAGEAVQPPPPAVAGPQHPVVVEPPAAPPHAAVVPPAPPVAAGPPAGLTGVVTVGDGGTGWSVKDIRYGAHAGYLRMVLDFLPGAGAASGTPRVTIGFQDPTTLIITLDQVTSGGAPAAPGPGSVITSISLQSPPPATGSTSYVVKLAHAIQFTPSFASSPLRLIVDLH